MCNERKIKEVFHCMATTSSTGLKRCKYNISCAYFEVLCKIVVIIIPSLTKLWVRELVTDLVVGDQV